MEQQSEILNFFQLLNGDSIENVGIFFHCLYLSNDDVIGSYAFLQKIHNYDVIYLIQKYVIFNLLISTTKSLYKKL